MFFFKLFFRFFPSIFRFFGLDFALCDFSISRIELDVVRV